MLQTKSINQKKKISKPDLFVKLVFAFFPISFILGFFFVNINFIYSIKSQDINKINKS